jgi:hypothetical protein
MGCQIPVDRLGHPQARSLIVNFKKFSVYQTGWTKIRRWPRLFSCGLAAILALVSADAFASPISITLDTSALSGSNVQLAFDLIDGDGVRNNDVVISAFAIDGILGVPTISGGVSGTLPGLVKISDTEFFNELLQESKLGSHLSFVVDSTNNFAGGPIPDGFSVLIIDHNGSSSLVTTSLLGDAIVAADLNGFGQVTIIQATTTSPVIEISQQIAGVPEPGPLCQFALGFVVLLLLQLKSRTGILRRRMSGIFVPVDVRPIGTPIPG